ncbi:hypothetical protein PIB30_052668 [Stylosanthes scabra]|uniref:Uncharacterized protein n=1 Tax=Stylosanthes scabra TaxID=79078 RepID=A0ABU6QIN1_9FABA|nr:hypothetical protein [Stylosanthes scabra]
MEIVSDANSRSVVVWILLAPMEVIGEGEERRNDSPRYEGPKKEHGRRSGENENRLLGILDLNVLCNVLLLYWFSASFSRTSEWKLLLQIDQWFWNQIFHVN